MPCLVTIITCPFLHEQVTLPTNPHNGWQIYTNLYTRKSAFDKKVILTIMSKKAKGSILHCGGWAINNAWLQGWPISLWNQETYQGSKLLLLIEIFVVNLCGWFITMWIEYALIEHINREAIWRTWNMLLSRQYSKIVFENLVRWSMTVLATYVR